MPCADTSVLNDADLSSACNLLVDGVLFQRRQRSREDETTTAMMLSTSNVSHYQQGEAQRSGRRRARKK